MELKFGGEKIRENGPSLLLERVLDGMSLPCFFPGVLGLYFRYSLGSKACWNGLHFRVAAMVSVT